MYIHILLNVMSIVIDPLHAQLQTASYMLRRALAPIYPVGTQHESC